MRNMLGLAVAAMLALSLAPGVAAQDTYTIDGIVTDQGQPVAGATVSWYQYGGCDDVRTYEEGEQSAGDAVEPARPCDYQEANAVTGADGRFSFAASQGWGSLQAWKEGHASHYQGIDVAGHQSIDIELVRFPDKTARIEGRITPGAIMSIDNPVYGMYECSQHEGAGGETKPEPRIMESSDGGSGVSSSDAAMIAPGEYYAGCAITIRADGTYFGNVTPGYSIITVHGGWSDGGQSHYTHSVVRDLPANATTRIDVSLKVRPGPDVTLSGYVVDGATKTAIPGAHVSFSNQDSYGWASAQTDRDGSYKVALRNGMVQVHVWVDGYLPWEGQIDLSPGAERSFDITLTAGQVRYGGCCIAYADGESTPTAGQDMAKGLATSRQSEAAAGENDFEDLGGGLGPYDPARADAEAERESPGLEVLAFIGLLGLLAIVRRR